MPNVIYEPAGRAAEYCLLAVNLYAGCPHGCTYCFVPAALRRDRAEFQREPHPRKDILELLEADKRPAQPGEQVLLSFTSDPYQPIERELRITRQAIELLHGKGYGVRILTKAGALAQRDFDLLDERDSFGVTLTCLTPEMSERWEPLAALPGERMANLRAAQEAGIPTWVSMEPVLDPVSTLALIDLTHDYVGEYKVGTLNHHPHASTINWRRFARDVKAKLDGYRSKYYLKKDLAKWL